MESVIYTLCTTLPNHIIAFGLYWNYSWRSKKLAVTLVCINMLVKTLLVWWALPNGWNIQSVESVISLIGAGIYFYMIQMDKFKLLFTYILIINYLMVVRGFATTICYYLFSTDTISWQTSMVCVLIYILTLPWMLIYFRKINQRICQIDAPALWRTIWMLPALTSIVVLLFTNTFNTGSGGDWRTFFARLSLLACTLIACFVLVRALGEVEHRAVLEEQNRQNQNILSLQRTQYAQLQSHMEEVRRARHDLRQYQNIIQACLDSNDTEQLRGYLKSQLSIISNDTPRKYCQNYAVNLLLNHYAGQYHNLRIDFAFDVQLPADLKSGEPDVCVVIGNLLENAQEACTGQKEPYIRAVTRLNGSRGLTILVDNTAPTPPSVREDGSLQSSKGANHGIGTQSVRYIAQEYGGTADFKWKDGMFLASVFLNL